jgi:hypothetical protein
MGPAVNAVMAFGVGLPRRSWASLGGFVIAASAALGLLVALGQVARDAVEQGEQRRLATETHWQATWRCNALRERGARLDCLARLSSPPTGVVRQVG